MKRILSLTIIGLMALAGLARAGEYSLSPSASAIISPGNDNDLSTGQRVLVKFDLPNDIDDKQIGRAFISFTHNFAVKDGSGSLEFKVYPLTASWNAQEVDWDSWTNDGGDFDKRKGYSFSLAPGPNTKFYIVVTEQSKCMADGELTNHGFILIPGDLHGHAYEDIDPETFDIPELVTLELEHG